MGARQVLGIVIALGLLLGACGQAAAPAPPTQAPAAAATQPAAAKVEYPTMSLKAGSTFNPDHVVSIAMDRFIKNVAEMSGGKITIEPFYSGALVTGKTELESLGKGTVNFGSVTPIYHAGPLPFLEEASFLPLLYSYKSTPLLMQKARPLLEQELAAQNIKLIVNVGTMMSYYFKRPIDPKNPDFSGRKLRSAGGVLTKMFRTFGASTIDMPSPDIPVALRTGVMEGLSTSLFSWDTLGIMEDTPYAYYSPTSVIYTFVATNKSQYEQWPPAVQQLIDKAAQSAEQWMVQNVERLEGDIIKKAQNNPKIKFHSLTPEEDQVWRAKMEPVYEDFAKRHGDKGAQFVKAAKEALEAAK